MWAKMRDNENSHSSLAGMKNGTATLEKRWQFPIKLDILFFFLIFFSMFIYFWDRERQSMNGGEAEREGDTESETGSRL